MTNPVSLPFIISCRIFLCSLTLSSTSLFLTQSVQMIFSILLQHHISKFSRCFWTTATRKRPYYITYTISNLSTQLLDVSSKIFQFLCRHFYVAECGPANWHLWHTLQLVWRKGKIKNWVQAAPRPCIVKKHANQKQYFSLQTIHYSCG